MKGNARYALVIFLVALLLRLGYLAWRWLLLPDWNVDASGYHQLAVNLVQQGIFSLNTQPPFHPDAIRTPGYPLFIAAVYVLSGINPRTVLVVQAILDAVTALLVMGISRNLGLSKGIAAVTGLLYALSPLAWRYSAELYVESILAFAVAVMFWLLSRPSMRPGWAGIHGLGIACGVTLLVKPNMVLLPVILAIALLIRSGLRQTLLFVLATGLVLMPWVIRNALVFGRPMLSTAFENNLARVSAPATLAEASGEEVAPWTPRWEALFFEVVDRAARTNPQLFATPADAMNPRESDQATLALADTAREIIANHPAAFVASHVKGVLHGLLPGEYRFWFGQFSGQTWESAMPAGIAGTIRARGWQAVPLLALILFVASVAVTVASGVAMSVGWWRLVRHHVVIVSAMGAFILYVLLLPGPIAYERFQVPAVPLVAILIGCVFEPETHKMAKSTNNDGVVDPKGCYTVTRVRMTRRNLLKVLATATWAAGCRQTGPGGEHVSANSTRPATAFVAPQPQVTAPVTASMEIPVVSPLDVPTVAPSAVGRESEMNNIDPNNPTLKAQFERALAEVIPISQPVRLTNSHLVGPFDNTDLIGVLTSYAPEPQPELDGVYAGKHGQVQWQPARAFDGVMTGAVDLGASIPKEPHSVIYYYAEVEATETTLAQLSLACSGLAGAWFNGVAVLQPTIPEPADPQRDAAWVELKAGKNTLLVKAAFSAGLDQRLGCWVKAAGQTAQVTQGVEQLIHTAKQPAIRLLAQMTLSEVLGAAGNAVAGNADACRQALEAVREDAYATRWEAAWADAIECQYEKSGHFAPFHDPAVSYQPVTQVQPYPEFWPQSSRPVRELLVVDVSNASPQVEFALAVLQGLVNRAQPRLYLLHSRYARQDRQWLDELHFEGFTSQEITIDDAWRLFKGEIQGAVIYDGNIMDEIGAFHSDQLNQTNVLMMIGALNSAVPLTPELNTGLGLAVLFDARGKWANQYDMMRWAFVELFPHMNPRMLATNYPGIFLITDYLVAFKIFTFWFPEYRTPLEENLLHGILAATPPNSPILGWWFDWMPNVKDAKAAHADAVMEGPGLLVGSYFGKILTPSHEATNLSVHSGVPVGTWRHKTPDCPVYDPSKVYYTFMISDGDNMGEALMMRTRDLQWDKPERGAFPMGWSFAPATSHLAPPVLNYYLRTAAPNDLLMGGLGVGYTEPIIYLRAYPEQREQLWAQYARATDQAMGWIDTTCLWLIDGRHEEADRYASGSSGRLRGIFIGYGGSPDIAEARITHNDVVAFYSASRFMTGKSREEQIQAIVDDIRAATRSRPDFIEAWVLNWGLEMSMLQQVQERLGPDYVCVRPDVLVETRLHATGTGKERD